MKNLELAKILYNLADILELEEIKFKPQAYRNAARQIEALTTDIADWHKQGKLEDIPGVGKSIAQKISEFLKTGKISYYEELKKKSQKEADHHRSKTDGMLASLGSASLDSQKFHQKRQDYWSSNHQSKTGGVSVIKINLEELKQIPQLGTKRIKMLYQELKIKDLDDLENALRRNKIRQLPGFGEETEKNLLRNIQLIKNRPQRLLYYQALPLVREIKRYFSQFNFIQKIEIAGSFRRGKETVGDLDFLAVSRQPEKAMALFTRFPEVKEILAQGTTKSSVRLANGLQLDLRIVKKEEFGSAWLYFTGNKEHNIELRKLALSKGYTLNEYGLFQLKTKKRVAGRTEEEIYQQLGLKYMEPELRENYGEIAAAKKGQLPQLVQLKEIKGIFHNHTKWSDGANSLLEMAQKAEELGFKFISFNDHFGSVGITHPLNEKRLKGYLEEIKKVQKKVNLTVFSGIEIDINKGGTLPFSRKNLKRLDVVIAAVHQNLKMTEAEMTARLCHTLNNYPIHILAHPTDRLINFREPLTFNLEKVFETAKKNNVFLEINAFPERMDLSDFNIKKAKELGCRFALSTDAHDLLHLETSQLGFLNARRGWLEKKDILNCWNLSRIKKQLL